MDMEKRSAVLSATGTEAIYYVTVDDIILLASRAGVLIHRNIAADWIRDPQHRRGIAEAMDRYIQDKVTGRLL